MEIKNFIEFILESKGISDICLEYKNIIWKNFYSKMKSIISSGDNYGQLSFNFNNDQFKIYNLIIEINMNSYKENICNAKFIGKKIMFKDNTFYNPKIEFDIYYLKFNKNFFNYIESTILHELLHCYQMYKLNGKKIPSYWQYGSKLSKIRGDLYKLENDDINHIIDLLYYSLEHEMNAQLHQYYDYLLKNEEYERIFSIENSLRNYEIPNINKELINSLKEIIKTFNNSLLLNSPNNNYSNNINKSLWSYNLNEYNIESFLRNLKKYFTNSANYLSKKIRQINRKVENWEHIDYTMLLTENEIFYNILKN